MNKKRILIIDDQDSIRIYLSKHYADKYDVLLAKTGEEGLETLARESVDLVITDDTMPGIHGLEVLATIKEKYRSLPAIMMSSFGNHELAREVENQGFRYIPKPLNLDRLDSMIAGLVKDK